MKMAHIKLTVLAAVAALCGAVARGHSCDRSLDDFPAQPGESDSARLQRAVNALPEGSLYVPRGVYLLTDTLMVTNRCSLELNRAATLKAATNLDYVVAIDARPFWKTWNQFFVGGIIEADGKASCMALDGFSPYSMRNVTFLNGTEYGLRVNGRAGGGGIFASELYFRCTKRGLAGNTALYSSGCDGTYNDCLVVDWTVGFRMDGGGNRLTGCHAWGGTIPPVAKGRLPEMLENSVCFHLGGWDNLARDCYADTGAIGYVTEGWGIQILGSWFLNNTQFKLTDIVIIDQRKGDLSVSDCRFSYSPGTKVYRGSLGTKVAWQNMFYRDFPRGAECPGAVRFAYNDRNLRPPVCADVNEWEFVQEENGLVYTSPAGEYLGKKRGRNIAYHVPTDALNRMFPQAGPAREVVIRARATTAGTKSVEVAFTQEDGLTWGKIVPLTSDWQEIRIPVAKLEFFRQWSKSGEVRPDGRLDVRKLERVTLTHGLWICKETAKEPHGFEVSSIRIVREQGHAPQNRE